MFDLLVRATRTDALAVVLSMLFFFQAEDGIRDLVRSRGLGDVYKRQAQDVDGRLDELVFVGRLPPRELRLVLRARLLDHPVSYTHLTLPTSDLV